MEILLESFLIMCPQLVTNPVMTQCKIFALQTAALASAGQCNYCFKQDKLQTVRS